MNTVNLKEYLKMVLDLECAIYQTENFQNKYLITRERQAPQKPVLQELSMPQEPTENPTLNRWNYLKNNPGWLVLLFGVVACAVAFLIIFIVLTAIYAAEGYFGQDFDDPFWVASLVVSVVMFALGALIFVRIDKNRKEYNAATLQENDTSKKQYERALQHYNENYEMVAAENAIRMENSEKELGAYNAQTAEVFAKSEETLESLRTTLEKLYAKDVVYGKYRNFVTVAMLLEYIESGRCSTLEGADGAYNLYETELRANIIIGSLNSIMRELEAIKDEQYLLYQRLYQANAEAKLLLNANDTQQITAYFANQAALVALAEGFISADMQ